MKKKIAWLMTLVVAMVGLFSLVACGSSKAGVYKLDSVQFLGKTIRLGEEHLGVTLSKDILKVELNKDGSYSLIAANKIFDSATGTWAENEDDKDKIDITVGGVTTSVFCNGREIQIKQLTMTIILKK